jgi:PAS domain S-box-containing protein
VLYTLSGEAREAFEKFGLPRATPLFGPTFRGEGIVRSDDITKDPRYGQMGPHRGMPQGHLPVRSYLAVPVISRSGEVLGGLFFGHRDTGVFTEQSERLISGIAAQAAIGLDNARLYESARDSELRFRMIADNMNQLAWTCDKLGNCTWYNQRWLDYTGLTFEDMKDWGWTKCHHPDHIDAVIASVKHSRETGEPWEHTFPLRSKDGEYRWFLSRAVPIKDKQGNIIRWFGTNTDITEQIEAEERLHAALDKRTEEVIQAQQRLATSQRMAAVGTLASGLAHDLTNVLLPLRMRLDMLVTHASVDGATRDHLTAVQGLMTHLNEMSRNLSMFARDPEKEGIIGETDLADWWQRVQRLVESSIRDSGVKFECDMPEDLPAIAIAPHRLTQVVLNLVHNGRNAIVERQAHNPSDEVPGCVKVTARVRERALPGGQNAVTISVIDNGCGMDEDTKRRSIEPFFTTHDRPNAPGMGGSGMGLTLAHSIIERAGGRLDIQSEPGKGTTIALTLPIAGEREPH